MEARCGTWLGVGVRVRVRVRVRARLGLGLEVRCGTAGRPSGGESSASSCCAWK